jgi:hypothetical protein
MVFFSSPFSNFLFRVSISRVAGARSCAVLGELAAETGSTDAEGGHGVDAGGAAGTREKRCCPLDRVWINSGTGLGSEKESAGLKPGLYIAKGRSASVKKKSTARNGCATKKKGVRRGRP